VQWPGLEGMDLTGEVSCVEPYEWIETPWSIEGGYGQAQFPDRHVGCVDYGGELPRLPATRYAIMLANARLLTTRH
jgi:hypothetical protein